MEKKLQKPYLTDNNLSAEYELDPVRFLPVPRLAWQAALKNRVKLDLLTDINMLLMVQKGYSSICKS